MLPRRVTLFGQRAADVLAGVDHVIRLLVAGGMAAVVTEAGTLQELGELPGLGVRQRDGDLDDGFVIHDALVPESASMSRRQAST